MRKKRLIAVCCCIGVVLSALLPCAVLLWGESLIGKTFSLPTITYRLQEEQFAESSDLRQVLILLAEGEQEISSTIDSAEIDAFVLMDRLREEISILQSLSILPTGEYSFPRPAVQFRYSLPKTGAVSLWEFTASFGEETVLLRFHPLSGRILALDRILSGEVPSSLAKEVREGYNDYLTEYGLPGTAQISVKGNKLLISARYLEDTLQKHNGNAAGL